MDPVPIEEQATNKYCIRVPTMVMSATFHSMIANLATVIVSWSEISVLSAPKLREQGKACHEHCEYGRSSRGEKGRIDILKKFRVQKVLKMRKGKLDIEECFHSSTSNTTIK
jgi:hypothetical protein